MREYIQKYKSMDIEIVLILIIALFIVNWEYFKGIQIFLSSILIMSNIFLIRNFLNRNSDYENE